MNPRRERSGKRMLPAGRGAGAVGDGVVTALVQAVQAHHAFADPDPSGRFAGALAVALTQPAVGAPLLFAADAPNGKAAQDAEERAEGADKAAVETRDPEVEKEGGQKHSADQPRPFVPAGQRRGAQAGAVGQRQKYQVDRAMDERQRVEKPGQQRSRRQPVARQEDGGGEEKNQDVIFDRLGGPEAVRLQLDGQFFPAPAQVSQELVHRPERTDPAAEHTPQNEGEGDGYKSPQQAGVERARGQQGCDPHQRVQLEQPVDRPAPELPGQVSQGGNHAEPEKDHDEKHLADAPRRHDAHADTSTGDSER